MVHIEAVERRVLMAVTAVSGDVRATLDSDYGSPEAYLAGGDGTYMVGWTNFNDDEVEGLPRTMGRGVRFNDKGKRLSPEVSLPGEYFASAGPVSTPAGFGVVSSPEGDSAPLVRYYSANGKQVKVPRAIGGATNDTVHVGTDRTGAGVVLLEEPNGQGPARVYFLSPTGQVKAGPKALAVLTPAGASSGEVDARYVSDMAVARDGSFWVSYYVNVEEGTDYCVLQRYDKTGKRAGTAINLSKWVGGAWEAELAVTPQGGVVAAVTYSTGEAGEDGANGITVLKFSASSAIEAGAFNTATGVSDLGGTGLAVDDRGVVFLTYTKVNPPKREGYARTGYDVMGRTFSSDLTTNQKPFVLSKRVDEFELDPEVVSIGGNRFAVAWVRLTAHADDPEAPDPAVMERDVYTRVFTVSDPKAKPAAGQGPILGPVSTTLPFRSGWYYAVVYAHAEGFVFNQSVAFVRIEGTPVSALVKEVLIPSDDELAAAAQNEPVIENLGTGSVFVPGLPEFSTNNINHKPVVWAPGTMFRVFSYHSQQPGFVASGRLVKFSNVTEPTSHFGPFGPPRYKVIGGKTTTGPGVTSKASNIGMFNSGEAGGLPQSDQIIYFLAKKGGYDWSMTFYRLEGTPEAALHVPVDA